MTSEVEKPWCVAPLLLSASIANTGPTSSELECYLPLLPESLEIGNHRTDADGLQFEGQAFTAWSSAYWETLVLFLRRPRCSFMACLHPGTCTVVGRFSGLDWLALWS